MRNKKDVNINGEKFTIQEVSIGEVMPLMPKFGTDEAQQAQLELMQLCIYQDGERLGEKVNDLGLTRYMELAKVVMEVNGLAEGKD